MRLYLSRKAPMSNRYLKIIAPALTLGAILGVWQVVVSLFRIPVYVLPPPSSIVIQGVDDWALLSGNVSITLLESAAGFVAGSIVGFFLGVVMAEFDLFARCILPFVVGSNAVPVIAIAPLVVLWLGTGIASKIALAAFLCFFPLCINTFKGLQASDKQYRLLFSLYGATKREYLFQAKLPAAEAYIFAGLKLNAVFSVIGAIVAEFIGANGGLGFAMVQASYNLQVPRLWVNIIMSVCMGLAFYGLVWLFERIILKRFHYSGVRD